MPDLLPTLIERVQTNCDRADARSAQQFTLCTYLLKMREFYRWSQGLDFSAPLEKRALHQWIVDQEERWETLEEEEFEEIPFQGDRYDPFDQAGLGDALAQAGYVYSGGLGRACWPHFFLAELESEDTLENTTCRIAGKELARGMVAPPAFVRDGVIHLRREALKFWVHGKVEEWQFKKRKNPIGRALASFDLSESLAPGVEALSERALPLVLRHELGELQIGRQLGPLWPEMLVEMGRTQAELIARAAKDLAADCLSTWPYLLEEGDDISVHWHLANHTGLSAALWPELIEAYLDFAQSGSRRALSEITTQGQRLWPERCASWLELYQDQGSSAANQIVAQAGLD